MLGKNILYILLLTLACLSCEKEKALTQLRYPVQLTDGQNDEEDNTNPSEQRRLKQSIRIHDDNINGTTLKIVNRVQEVVNFFYNSDGLLDSLSVLSDTSAYATLKKTMKFRYLPEQNIVRANMYEFRQGNFVMDFHYDNNKNVIKFVHSLNGVESGIFYFYNGQILQNQKYVFGKVGVAGNFIYDSYYNLTQYEVYTQLEEAYRIHIDYDYSRPVEEVFDIRFNSVEFALLHEGGVNIISLLGLKAGLGNSHYISKRSEFHITDGAPRNHYDYEYLFNTQGDLVHRKIIVNDSMEVNYEYNY